MENETKKCKYCQSDIPKKAKICPNCQKKQKGKGKIILLAVILIIVIIIAASCVSCMNSFGSKSDDKSNVVAPQKTAEDTSAPAEEDTSDESSDASEVADDTSDSDESGSDTLSVGSTIEKDGLKITVNEANANFTDYSDEYGWNTPADGMKYVMCSFTFENTGNTDEYVSIYDFSCYADNTECEQVYSLDDSDFINTNLSSGRNISFKTYYSVPTDAQEIELEYTTNAWTGEKAIIKIQ